MSFWSEQTRLPLFTLCGKILSLKHRKNQITVIFSLSSIFRCLITSTCSSHQFFIIWFSGNSWFELTIILWTYSVWKSVQNSYSLIFRNVLLLVATRLRNKIVHVNFIDFSIFNIGDNFTCFDSFFLFIAAMTIFLHR